MPRLLIIENEPIWMEALRATLSVPDFTVDLTTNKDQAIASLEKNQYDAVVADLHLGGKGPNHFAEFGDIIASMTRLGQKKGRRVPIIVVTSTGPDRSSIIKALNNYPGWIWGWQDKDNFDQDALRQRVSTAISESQRQPLPAKSPSWIRGLAIALSLFVVVTAAACLLSASNLGTLLEPVLLTITLATVVLTLLVMMLANPEMVNTIMPFILGLFGRNRKKD